MGGAVSAFVEDSIGNHLILAARLHRLRAAQLLAKTGLFPGQDMVLLILARFQKMAMGDLAAALHVRPPTASKTVARLSAQGFIQRLDGVDDGRVVQVSLTESGRAMAETITMVASELEQELLGDLDSKDSKRFRKLLRKTTSTLARKTGSAILALDEASFDEALEEAN
jgi:DNA-binding MarR family transcriptional regulator